MGTDAEKKTMVVSMAKARGASRVRFLAIGVFLSMLAVNFEHLIKTMKKTLVGKTSSVAHQNIHSVAHGRCSTESSPQK
jgi:hypothetical protein